MRIDALRDDRFDLNMLAAYCVDHRREERHRHDHIEWFAVFCDRIVSGCIIRSIVGVVCRRRLFSCGVVVYGIVIAIKLTCGQCCKRQEHGENDIEVDPAGTPVELPHMSGRIRTVVRHDKTRLPLNGSASKNDQQPASLLIPGINIAGMSSAWKGVQGAQSCVICDTSRAAVPQYSYRKLLLPAFDVSAPSG